MNRKERHYKVELQGLLYSSHSPELRPELEDHLRSCLECRRELDALRWTLRHSRNAYAADQMPANLETGILSALDCENGAQTSSDLRSWFVQWRRGLAYGSLFCVVTLAFTIFIFWRAAENNSEQLAKMGRAVSPINLEASVKPGDITEVYRDYVTGNLPLGLKTEDVSEMEKFFLAQGISFETRVFDFRMMNYNLQGGRVNKLDGHEIAFYAYLGKDNKILICQMYRGNVADLPAGAELRENKGIRFYVYRLNGLTTVFWQEGEVTCVLTSDVDSEKIVQLAFAKAVKI